MAFASPMVCRRATFDGSRTWVVGVLNVTPDSFSDGGKFLEVEAAVAHGVRLAGEGAAILDVGGHSTRPGYQPIGAAEEIERVVPVIRALAAKIAAPISIDTFRGEVAEAAIAAGAEIVNDVTGGARDGKIAEACARHRVPLVAGHWREGGEVSHGDVFEEVCAELSARIAAAREAGVGQIVADPGLGFGKTGAHNLELIARAGELSARLGVPVMVGPSRKRFLGELVGRPAAERDAATVGAAVAAALRGADFVRVHDVRSVRDGLAVADAVRRVGR